MLPNPDCLALGCDWNWGAQPCECGRPHIFRICTRCLRCDDPACDTANDQQDGSEVAA